MILLAQALLFYMPYGIWMALSSNSGIDIHSIVEAGQSFTVTDMTEIRDKTLQYMTMIMDRYALSHMRRRRGAVGGHMPPEIRENIFRPIVM